MNANSWSYGEWVKLVKIAMHQLDEGAITQREFFNCILSAARQVKQTDIDEELA